MFFLGVFFGAATFFLVFASKVLYGQNINFNTLMTYDYIMYLCVCLMAAAAIDIFTSPNKDWGNRISPLLFCVISVLILYVIFNPMLTQKPDETILKTLALCYIYATIIFCGAIKMSLFYEENYNLKNVKF